MRVGCGPGSCNRDRVVDGHSADSGKSRLHRGARVRRAEIIPVEPVRVMPAKGVFMSLSACCGVLLGDSFLPWAAAVRCACRLVRGMSGFGQALVFVPLAGLLYRAEIRGAAAVGHRCPGHAAVASPASAPCRVARDRSSGDWRNGDAAGWHLAAWTILIRTCCAGRSARSCCCPASVSPPAGGFRLPATCGRCRSRSADCRD